MKYIILYSGFTLISFLSAAQHAHDITATDKPSTHGMVIFGGEKIYASHLPLFHAPHDYQIILELELTKADKKILLKDQALHPEFSSYTIEPEKFILPDMINRKGNFKVNVYRGHFERGGTKIAGDINVKIVSVIYFTRLDPSAIKPSNAEFILFGNSVEQFAVHRITGKPDFDQIILIKTDLEPDKINGYSVAAFNNSNSAIGVSGNTIEANVTDKKLNLTLLKQVYLEFDDLLE